MVCYAMLCYGIVWCGLSLLLGTPTPNQSSAFSFESLNVLVAHC